MEEYEIRISSTKEEIKEIEILRRKAFHLKMDSINRFEFHIKYNKIIPFAMYKDNEIVAGCYIMENFDSLYVSFLFVEEQYRNQGLRLGRRLLSYILENKEMVEERFNRQFDYSRLHPNNEKSRSIYKKVGYEDTSCPIMEKKL